MINLLYVCAYNTDRSPVAEQITQWKIGAINLSVSSAGLKTAKPHYFGLSEEMHEALRRLGYTAGKHVPKLVTSSMLSSQDLILCMRNSHVEEVLRQAPGLEDKVYTLSEYAGFPGKEVLFPS